MSLSETLLDAHLTEVPTDSPLEDLLRTAVELDGSDLHLTVGIPPRVRVHGSLRPLQDRPPLTMAQMETMVRLMLSDAQWAEFHRENELDLALGVVGLGRFRANLFRQRGSIGAVLRVVPNDIKHLDELGVPPVVADFAQLHGGLVLVTGPTGSGKSTTLASLVDLANRTRQGHIVTIEDPIEYTHHHGSCVVNQRELGTDTSSFALALRQALRQDPDIIMVGELRDVETTTVALTAAETGHLVLATLHTQSAAESIDRLIHMFPAGQQDQVRTQVAGCLRGVVTQALAPARTEEGRVGVFEVMVVTAAIRNLIRESKVHQILAAMQSGGEVGMITFDQHLALRYAEGHISKLTALDLAHDPDEFVRLARL